jgi:hypothetical protein
LIGVGGTGLRAVAATSAAFSSKGLLKKKIRGVTCVVSRAVDVEGTGDVGFHFGVLKKLFNIVIK